MSRCNQENEFGKKKKKTAKAEVTKKKRGKERGWLNSRKENKKRLEAQGEGLGTPHLSFASTFHGEVQKKTAHRSPNQQAGKGLRTIPPAQSGQRGDTLTLLGQPCRGSNENGAKRTN